MVQWVLKKVLGLVPGIGPIASKLVSVAFIAWKLARIAPKVWDDGVALWDDSERWWTTSWADRTLSDEEIDRYFTETLASEGATLAKRARDAYAATRR